MRQKSAIPNTQSSTFISEPAFGSRTGRKIPVALDANLGAGFHKLPISRKDPETR
jgi:hypothetical protein